jgi:AhpD family alkylhydroperoxidase
MPRARSRVSPNPTLRAFAARFPRLWREYQALCSACDAAGPLSPKTRELIRVGIEVARKRHGGLIAHARRARAAGASAAELSQAIALTVPLVGLPDALDAFRTVKRELR